MTLHTVGVSIDCRNSICWFVNVAGMAGIPPELGRRTLPITRRFASASRSSHDNTFKKRASAALVASGTCARRAPVRRDGARNDRVRGGLWHACGAEGIDAHRGGADE